MRTIQVQALDCLRPGFRPAQRRQQQRSENRDDRDNNQKFEKGVDTPTPRRQYAEYGLAICLELHALNRTHSMRTEPRPWVAQVLARKQTRCSGLFFGSGPFLQPGGVSIILYYGMVFDPLDALLCSRIGPFLEFAMPVGERNRCPTMMAAAR